MILIILLYIICATTFTLSKTALLYSLPVFYIGIRMTFAGAILLAWYLLCHRSLPKINKSDYFLLFQIMFFGVYVAYILDLWSLQFLTSIESSLVFNISPFLSAFFSYLYFSEYMTPKKWIGLFIGFISLIPLMLVQCHNACIIEHFKLLPLCALICSVASSAYGWVVMRELVFNRNYPFLFINGTAMFFGGILALGTSHVFESWSHPVFDWSNFILYTALIIIASNLMFSNLYSYLLKKYTATLLSFFGFLCPLFATIFGMLFLKEPFNPLYLYAFCGVLLGLIIFYQEELRQGYVK